MFTFLIIWPSFPFTCYWLDKRQSTQHQSGCLHKRMLSCLTVTHKQLTNARLYTVTICFLFLLTFYFPQLLQHRKSHQNVWINAVCLATLHQVHLYVICAGVDGWTHRVLHLYCGLTEKMAEYNMQLKQSGKNNHERGCVCTMIWSQKPVKCEKWRIGVRQYNSPGALRMIWSV